MSHLTEFIVNFGNVIELDFPQWNVEKIRNVITKHPGWKYYQPHKPGYNRYGLSVTSLDGGYSGEPDLFSLREYNQINNTQYWEQDFQKRTSIVEFLPELNELLDFFGTSLGRAHFLKLNKGGFFPPHRDNGLVVNVESYRILVPICNFGINDMKWIQEEKVLRLDVGKTYFINTSRPHSLFSFVDDCIMLVLNVITDAATLDKLVKKVVPK